MKFSPRDIHHRAAWIPAEDSGLSRWTGIKEEQIILNITVVKLRREPTKCPHSLASASDGGSLGGRRLVPPGPSGRGCESPLGFEPVVPVGADGLAPR